MTQQVRHEFVTESGKRIKTVPRGPRDVTLKSVRVETSGNMIETETLVFTYVMHDTASDGKTRRQ